MALWEEFAILAAAIWAISNIMDKYTLTKLVKAATINEISLFVIVFIAVLLGIFNGFAALSIVNFALALFAGLLEALAIFFYFYAAKFDEISRIAPVFAMDTLFVAVIAVFTLREVFSLPIYVGIG
ncbi:MAG: EamA family transporter, partial [Candidatus Micrarchaeota archaeon]|nr:EamA family transporter [Candidatus Micrarchaeota archaeon]